VNQYCYYHCRPFIHPRKTFSSNNALYSFTRSSTACE